MRDLSSHVHWLNARLHIVIAIVVALVVAAGFGVSAGEGDFRFVYGALVGAGVVAIMGMLGEKYWLLVPFSLTCQLPAIPIMRKAVEVPELVIAACSVTFACRFALKRQHFTLFHSSFSPMLLYIGWATLVFIQNPVGLDMMGAETSGARFYIKLALTLASFIIVANQQITDRDCRTVIVLALTGSLLSTAYNISVQSHPAFAAIQQSQATADSPLLYTWHQNLAIVPIMAIMLLLARFRSKELFSLDRLGWMLVLLVCCGLVMLSGKRTAVAAIPLVLVAAAALRREYSFVFLWVGGAVVALALIVALHGTLFTLPLLAQRSLSWLPGRWDSTLSHMEGGKDEFRERLRELAMEKIRDDPWLGRGYAVDRRLLGLIAATPNQHEKFILQMAQGSSWHNTWLGYAADFGIPASVLQAVIYAFVICLGVKTCKRLPPNSMRFVIVFFVVLQTVRDVVMSHHEGHSSLGPYLRWWMYGIVVAIALRTRSEAIDDPSEKPLPLAKHRALRPSRMALASRPRPVPGRP